MKRCDGLIKFVVVGALVLCSVGCRLRDLYYEQLTPVQVRVNIDWTNFGVEPSGATILFYPEDGSAPYEFKTHNVDSEVVSVPAGFYNVLVFNLSKSEFGSFSFVGMDKYESAAILLEKGYFAWLDGADTIGRTVSEPEKIMSGVAEHFEVSGVEHRYVKEKVSGQGSVYVWSEKLDTVTVTPKRIVFNGYISVHIKGIENVNSIRAYMTGLSGGVYLASRIGAPELATFVPQTWEIVTDKNDNSQGCLNGSFLCLGLPEQYRGFQVPSNSELRMELLLRDMATIVDTTFLVGDLIIESEEEFHLDLSLEVETPVPEVVPYDGHDTGFDFDFEDWGDTEDIVLCRQK